MSSTRQRWRLLRGAGWLVFGLGFAVFVGILGVGEYRPTLEGFDQLVATGAIQSKHAAVLADELERMHTRRFAWVRPLVAEVDRAITAANLRLADGDKIWDYDRGRYRYLLANAASGGAIPGGAWLFFRLSIVLASCGALMAFLARLKLRPPGIDNDGVMASSARSRGAVGLATGAFLIVFYVLLYFYPEYIVSWIRIADPVSFALRGQASSQWFFYGLMYSVVVLVMGVRMIILYRHSRYHLVRTASVMFFQLGIAFLLPSILASLHRPEVDFKNIWPLDYSFFYSWRLESTLAGGGFGWFVLLWGLGLIFVAVPVLTYVVGKRWYCSWVCGCGGLAETLGDPYRHLSSKKLRAWRVERWTVHSVLALAVLMTAVVLVNFFTARHGQAMLGQLTWRLQSLYGFLIASIFSGVVGTGFYPLMGNRIWCRFGCPLAAVLGLIQRFKSRFRITVNGGQCISCGNCSTYCEMGIDVRAYAQRGQNLVRASCVGCGVCAAVCPRGVLRLENGPERGRFAVSDLVRLGAGSIPSTRSAHEVEAR